MTGREEGRRQGGRRGDNREGERGDNREGGGETTGREGGETTGRERGGMTVYIYIKMSHFTGNVLLLLDLMQCSTVYTFVSVVL